MTGHDAANDSAGGDWPDAEEEVLEETSEEEGGTVRSDPGAPTDLEKTLIRKLASYEIDFKQIQRSRLIFQPNPKWDGSTSDVVHLPRDRAAELLEQLSEKPRISPRWAGIVLEGQGYIEVLLRPNTQIMIRDQLARSFSRLVTDDFDTCSKHSESSQSAFPTLTLPRAGGTIGQFRLHLVDKRCCMELSSPSPACHVLANEGFTVRPRYLASLKIDFGREMTVAEIENEAEPIINSLIYELDVRNNIKARVARWPSKSDRRPLRRARPNRVVRFPQTKVDPEVSVLFGFAGSASGNPPLSFLSYYQVLENFFPLATRRSAIRKLELELSDPRFDRRDDKFLMRILTVGENAAAVSESMQLRTLLEEFVRGASLVEFFTESDWGKHFTKHGPIHGILDSINPENRNKPLSHQVADRVYRIRNRIVHAKDDPKFESVPALLPQSEEAESLWPDIELVRFLAFEVILSAQGRSK
ncbi:hypothetical protein [Streptomyces sp. DH41]|uniref:hypothetical protein n=1 Tax=Streptomyces sp. DH41 TaxID=3040125 RepID=UPI0024418B6F|nr:hypothetical protein [Streptomyces sp. DH41]MDG9728569.1 hypothetical protein [Streptomyces sp. DH41]